MSRAIYKDCWQGNGKIHVGSTTEAISFQANFKEAGYYTVQFDLAIPADADTQQIIMPRAELQWSVEGTQVRREITLARGNVISGAGQGVKVKMFDFSTLRVPATPIEYFVSAQVTKGTRPNGAGSRPPILEAGPTNARGGISTAIVANTALAGWFVPVNAGINAFKVTAAPTTTSDITTFGNGAFNGYECTLSPPAAATVVGAFNYNQFGTWQPLSPAARLIQIQNNSGVECYVQLLWGVEG